MKLALLTCAIYPTMDEARAALWIFLTSALKAGFAQEDIHLYGIGREFHRADWRTKKLIYQLDYLLAMPKDYTHILYSDGADGLIVGSVAEIIDRYKAMGSPDIVCSAYRSIANPFHEFNEPGLYVGCFDESAPKPYLHVGGYLAKREIIIDAFTRMLTLPRQTYDDCWNWMDAWKEGWFRPVIDSRDQLFCVPDFDAAINKNWLEVVAAGRVWSGNHTPNVIHLTGGHVEREGWKDYKLEPLARELGLI